MRKCTWNWATGRDWKDFVENDRKRLDFFEETVGRTIDRNYSQWGLRKKWGAGLRKHKASYRIQNHCEQSVKKMDIKGTAGEGWEWNEEHVIGN